MGGVELERLGLDGRALRLGQAWIEIDVAAKAAVQRIEGQVELRLNLRADLLGGERGIDALGIARAMFAVALGNVVAAMIGGEDDDIVDAGRIEHVEEAAQRGIEREHLKAHLAAFGAGAVADIVGGGSADDQKIGGGTLTQLHVEREARAERQNGLVELG